MHETQSINANTADNEGNKAREKAQEAAGGRRLLSAVNERHLSSRHQQEEPLEPLHAVDSRHTVRVDAWEGRTQAEAEHSRGNSGEEADNGRTTGRTRHTSAKEEPMDVHTHPSDREKTNQEAVQWGKMVVASD